MTQQRWPDPPQFPAGPFAVDGRDDSRRATWIAEVERVPERVRHLVDGLSHEQLDTTYRNWTIRQIVHHLADSHLNSYVRFKLALTEERPTIKPYDESRWSQLADALRADIGPSIQVLTGLHARWTHLLRSMSATMFDRTFYHPENKEEMPLWRALAYYAWHARHHTAQIEWVKAHKLPALRSQPSRGRG